jgi:hypothetical protein
MLGAVAERRMPGEEAELAAELNAMMPANSRTRGRGSPCGNGRS